MFTQIDETFGRIDFVANIAGKRFAKNRKLSSSMKWSGPGGILSMDGFVFVRKLVDACWNRVAAIINLDPWRVSRH